MADPTNPIMTWIRNLFGGGAPPQSTPASQFPVTSTAPAMTIFGPTNGPSRAVQSPAWSDRHRYFYDPPAPNSWTRPAPMVQTPWGEMSQEDYDAFMAAIGAFGGGGADNSLGYAQLAQQQEEFAQRMALEQQALAQQAELARLQREEQRRALAMQIGQAMNELTARNWETGLPWTLPKGTQYAPGFEPGGAVEGISRIGNVAYTPQRLVASNPPSRETMQQWLDDAIAAWGRS